MGTMASQITSLTIVYSAVYSGADQRNHQGSASLALCETNSTGTGEFPAQMASNAKNDDVIMTCYMSAEKFSTQRSLKFYQCGRIQTLRYMISLHTHILPKQCSNQG